MIDISSIKNFVKVNGAKILAFGSKNAPVLLTGSSIVLGWYGVYLFWTESHKADKRIEYEVSVEQEKVDDPELKKQVDIPVKRKVTIYFEYCWMSLLFGVASTGLAIAGQKLSLDRLAEMYVMTQFLTEKDVKKEKLIEKFTKEVGEKKTEEIKAQLIDDDFTDEEIIEAWNKEGGDGKILVLDHVLHKSAGMTANELEKGFYDANDYLIGEHARLLDKYVERKKNGPFYVGNENQFINDEKEYDAECNDIFSSLDLGEFLRMLHIIPTDSFGIRIGELNEFRFYGGKNPIQKNQVQKWRNYFMPNGDKITICDLDYLHLLCPTYESIERNPL